MRGQPPPYPTEVMQSLPQPPYDPTRAMQDLSRQPYAAVPDTTEELAGLLTPVVLPEQIGPSEQRERTEQGMRLQLIPQRQERLHERREVKDIIGEEEFSAEEDLQKKPPSSPSDRGPLGAVATQPFTEERPTAPKRTFPSKHPYVFNEDGTRSNVKLDTFKLGGRHYVIPTLVNGKDLSDNEAVAVAKFYGLHRYPSYGTSEQALKRSKELQDKVSSYE